ACDAQWPRDRHAAYRACVAEAPECADVAECAVAPAAPCAEYCAAAVPCGIDQAVGCEARCDDEHFANPVPELLFDACVVVAPACQPAAAGEPSVQGCRSTPQDGLACLGYCRAQGECGGGEESLGACLSRCGDGFVGDDGLRFRASRACLAGLGADAACAALDACVPDDLAVDCPAFCAGASACGVELTDCEAACAEDPLSRLRVLLDGPCLDEAAGACPAVRECLVTEVRPPQPGEQVVVVTPELVCPLWNQCGMDQFFGPCEQVLADFGRDGNLVECVYNLLRNQCPRDPEEIFICFEGGGGPAPPNPIADECRDLCEARAFCGDAAAQDQPRCRRDCEAQASANVADPVARVAYQLACAGAWSCPDLAACLDDSRPAAVCAQHCEALAGCDEGIDEAVCRADCDRDFGRLRQFDYRACVDLARAEGCGAIQACELAPAVPCDQACEALGACADVGETCAADCDDRHFVAPLDTTLEVACLLSADACEGEGGALACLEDPGPGARACLGFCRATTGECNPEAEDDLLACMNGCVAGFQDANGLRFAAGRACLAQVNPEAPCAVLQACLPAALEVDCEAHCGELAACQIPAEGCAAACAGGDVSLDTAGCVADARRANGGCAAVAACVDFTPPPASPACVASCEARRACDRAFDPFLCRLACTPEPAALPIQLACADVLRCDNADFEACFDLPADLNPACVAACADVPACGEAFADAQACAQRCTGQMASGRPDDNWPATIGACLADAIDGQACDVAAADACFNVGIELGRNQGFGHHGSCDTFNGCGDARTCANAACAFHGHGPALSWEEGLCMDLNANVPGGMDCDLFNQLPGPLDDRWEGFCNIPVAYDVVCLP
ncbi:MAG: hypothetical protein KC613_05415, partial [Myxococcales bacterium]|nr:hypothetical protein [Myxococcales bacterium]